jgi:polysaccharide biosynthesis/export protein
MKGIQWLLGMGLIISFFSGCRIARTGPSFDPYAQALPPVALTNLAEVEAEAGLDQRWLHPPTEPFRVGPGDRVEIELLNEPGTLTLATVGPDGKIYFYLLPGLDVWGLTLGEIRELIETETAAIGVIDPQVSVTLREISSRRVWLLGRLQNPGVYVMPSPMTLLEAISYAGGLMTILGTIEEIADLRRGFVVRQGEMLPVDFHRLLEEGDMTQNIYLEPDDFVYIPSNVGREIYVLGAVRAPQAVRYYEPTTLATVIASAGGPAQYGYLKQVAVIRGSLAEPRVAILDFEGIQTGKIPDILLEPQDIVFVPFSPYKHLRRYVNLIVETFVRAVAINEGARAGAREAVPVGVNIGIAPGVALPPGTTITIPAQ